MEMILKFYGDESGASAVEYALLLAFIAMAIFTSVQFFGLTVAGLFVVPWPGGS
jgi:Flp pilus assembly pilin Flp